MTEIPGMILWTGDYLADTVHLTTFQHGAYLLILMAMWRNGGKLPKDSKKLAMLAGMPQMHWRHVEKTIMDFMTIEDGIDGKVYITQKRLTNELKLALVRHQNREVAGRLGGLARALKNKESIHGNAVANEGNRLSTTITIPIKKKTFLNGELRQEGGWVPTKRVGGRIFKAGEKAPKYENQPVQFWETLKPEDCS